MNYIEIKQKRKDGRVDVLKRTTDGYGIANVLYEMVRFYFVFILRPQLPKESDSREVQLKGYTEKINEFFVKHIPHSIASEYIRYTLFDRTRHTDDIEIKMFRNIISDHGEELTNEFLKIIN